MANFSGSFEKMSTNYNDPGEVFDVYDEDGNHVGTARRSEVHGDPSLVHRSVHVLVFRPGGGLLLQKRSANKDTAPGKWDTSVGGHLGRGESYLAAAIRETAEELGIGGAEPARLFDFKHRTANESEDIRTYGLVWGGETRPEPSEIEELREWSRDEIWAALGSGVFTRSFETEWRLFLDLEERGELALNLAEVS